MKQRKVLAICMALIMAFSYMPTTSFAEIIVDAEKSKQEIFQDMPREGFWSTSALRAAVSNNLLNGFKEKDGNYIKPNEPLTRAQMAAIVNRTFGAKETAALSGVADISTKAWYYPEMAKAVKMGTIKLSDKIRPNDSVTRQEAFTILGRALKMEDGASSDLVKFDDAFQVSNWAISSMGSMVKAGYIKGDDNLLSPMANMTRAQFAVIMDSVIKEYITSPGTVTGLASGNVMVNSTGVRLENLTVTGDLIIGDGVGSGTVNLNNVVVKGNLIARGGGLESVIINGGSVQGKVIITKIDGKIRVFAEGGAEIEVIQVNDGIDDVVIEGTVGTLEVSSPNTPIIIKNATVNKIDIKTDGPGNVKVAETARVNNLVVAESAKGTIVDVEGTLRNFETSAPKTELSGKGDVANAKVNERADGSSINTGNTRINNKAEGVKGAGGESIRANSLVANNPQGTGLASIPKSSGGSSGTSSIVTVSQVTFQDARVGLTLTAVTLPGDATGTYQWQISDTKDGDYIDIEGATKDEYIPRAKAGETLGDEGKFIRVVFTATGNYRGTLTSQGERVYVLATDEDFSRNTNGNFKYTSQDKYVEIPHKIKGLPVTSYVGMFKETSVGGVKSTNKEISDMSGMFESSKADTLDLSELDTSNVTNMQLMFFKSAASKLDLNTFDTSGVINMTGMFQESKATTIGLSSFVTSKVTSMESMFFGSQASTLDLSSFDTSKVTNMSSMFSKSQATTLDLSSLNTSSVTSMISMFSESQAATLDLIGFDTSNVTNMQLMFFKSAASKLDLNTFDTSGVTNMESMFRTSQASTLDLSSFDTSKVTSMESMFSESQATTLDLSSFDTSKVTDMTDMFFKSAATTLDLSSFDTSKVTLMEFMFSKSQATTGYAKTQGDLDRFNASGNKPEGLNFTVKQIE